MLQLQIGDVLFFAQGAEAPECLFGERLLPAQWLAVGCIVVASAGATLSARRAVPMIGGE